jgi:hypothetical protein
VAHRYKLKYGDNGGYVVRDTGIKGHPILFRSHSKSETIAKTQELNGFKPVDGDEQTLGRQITEAARKVGY